MHEIVGMVTNVIQFFADSGNSVIEVLTDDKQPMVLIGRTEGREEVGLSYRFGITGSKDYTNKRSGKVTKQHQFRSWTPYEPKNPEAIVRYLATNGKGLGVGPVTARSMFDKLGENVLEIIRLDPTAAHVFGISPENSEHLSNRLKAHAAVEATKIELDSMFQSHSIPKAIIPDVIASMGVEAPLKIRRNPLQMKRFPGVGFRKADALYTALGLPLNRIKRQTLAMEYGMEENGDGSVWHSAIHLSSTASMLIGGGCLDPFRAMKLGLRAKLFAHYRTSNTDDGLWLANYRLAQRERDCAEMVSRLMTRGNTIWPDSSLLTQCTDHQRTAYQNATKGGIGILEGGPGTGKTFTVCETVRAIESKYGLNRVAICAPTNKASRRLTEGLAESNIPLAASTVYSMLGVDSRRNGNWKFRHNEFNPLPYHFVIFDEFSMADLDIFYSLLCAIDPRSTTLLLVGDVNQLPPVSPGAPLRDLLAANIHSGLLTETKRNSGRIVEVCRQIREDEPVMFSEQVTEQENCKFIECKPDDIFPKIQELLNLSRVAGIDPLWDVQPIVPINEKSDVSRKVLNEQLQQIFNPNGKSFGKCRFRIGDKTVVTSTHDAKIIDGDQLFDCVLTNGEIGKVIDVREKYIDLEIEGRQYRRYYKGKDVPCIDLGYAISGHKSQGSEWKIAIVIIDGSGAGMRVSSREWIYTSISRGKQYTFLLGSKRVMARQLKNIVILKRKTFLKELIEKNETSPLHNPG